VEGIPLGSCRNLARYRPARRDPALNFKTGKIEPLNVITQVGSGDEMHNPGDGRFYVTPATLGISGLAIGAASPVATGVGLLGRSGGGGCKTTSIPFLIKGTTSDPKFVPDVGGLASGMLKSQLGCAAGAIPNGQSGQSQSPADAVSSLFGKKKK